MIINVDIYILYTVNGTNGKRKFVVLGWQMINGNRRLLCVSKRAHLWIFCIMIVNTYTVAQASIHAFVIFI